MTAPPPHTEDSIPSDPIPARTERRIDTTRQPAQPPLGTPEDLGQAEGRLPHERDQTPAMTDRTPDPRIAQAQQDLARGLQDTDRGPPAGRAYARQQDRPAHGVDDPPPQAVQDVTATGPHRRG